MPYNITKGTEAEKIDTNDPQDSVRLFSWTPKMNMCAKCLLRYGHKRWGEAKEPSKVLSQQNL